MSVLTDHKTGRLFVQFVFKGETKKKRLPAGTTKQEAKQFEVDWKHRLFYDRKEVSKDDMLWEEFIDRIYLEDVAANHPPAALEKALVICKASMPFFKGMTIRSIKPADAERLKVRRMQTVTRHGHTRKPSTVHREMSIIRSAFSMAVRNDLADYNPCSRIRLPKFDNIQDKILPEADVDTFLRSFRNGLQRDICTVVLYTGLRQNDVFGLRKTHVNWKTGRVSLLQGKTKRRVSNIMHPKVVEILLRREGNGSDLYFPSYRTSKQLTTIKNGIKFACQRAGIPSLGMRDLRRTFGTQLHESGWDDKTVADCLGHSDLRSVHRYKRGTKIQEKAILSLDYRAKIDATTQEQPLATDANLLKELVEMRRIELLASALRTENAVTLIH